MISGHSHSKIKRIIHYWLHQSPTECLNLSKIKYVLYDGTYFHKTGCFITLMNARSQEIISHIYTAKEGYHYVKDWFIQLKARGLNPSFISMDGERSTIRALKETWPHVKIQRCLYHIIREGQRWLRTYPKTKAGQDLKTLLWQIGNVKSFKERNTFILNHNNWLLQHQNFVRSLPKNIVAYKDLNKTMTLIKNGLPDMFYFLTDENVHSTTNTLESFHSRLKSDYQRHRGLTEQNKIHYLKWYCYFNNA